ncbi:MAG TPA: CBS domain-containing protein [Vicinamibacterales bacterium]|jgi:CBS domain-containing protein|nr:CBS domain-containing protein [Vicinamibacterales bacterium]
MTVKELVTRDVKSCSPDTDLATAATMMWDGDCGVVPVVNEERRVVGMLTDRDICIAAATRGAKPSDVRVRDVMSQDLASCRLTDNVDDAMTRMKTARVRRLPVLDDHGHLAGILSLNDVAMRAECRPNAAVSGEAFLNTLKAISTHARETVAA